MLVTDRFIYVHLHKSGGTFLNKYLKQHFGARQLGAHLPSRLIPHALRGLPVLGFVRNPWSYYVAWHDFQAGMPPGNPLFRHLSDDGALGFKEVVRRLLNLGTDAALLGNLLAALPEAYTYKGPNLPRAALDGLRNSRVGFYTHLYHYMYAGHSGTIHLGRTDRMPQDFLEFLDRFDIPASEDARAAIAAQAAPSVAYADRYDEELRELVAQRDAELIRLFGYRFGD